MSAMLDSTDKPTMNRFEWTPNYTGGLNETLNDQNLRTTFNMDNAIFPNEMNQPRVGDPTELSSRLDDEVVGNEELPMRVDDNPLPGESIQDFSNNISELSPSTGTMIGATIASSIDSSVTAESNQESVTTARMGLGPNGHAFDAEYHAELQAQTNTQLSEVRGAMYSLGSLAGPEGLGLAIVAGFGVHDWEGVDQDTTPSTSGEDVNAATGAL